MAIAACSVGAAGRDGYQMVVDEAPSRAGASLQRYAFRIERGPEQKRALSQRDARHLRSAYEKGVRRVR